MRGVGRMFPSGTRHRHRDRTTANVEQRDVQSHLIRRGGLSCAKKANPPGADFFIQSRRAYGATSTEWGIYEHRYRTMEAQIARIFIRRIRPTCLDLLNMITLPGAMSVDIVINLARLPRPGLMDFGPPHPPRSTNLRKTPDIARASEEQNRWRTGSIKPPMGRYRRMFLKLIPNR